MGLFSGKQKNYESKPRDCSDIGHDLVILFLVELTSSLKSEIADLKSDLKNLNKKVNKCKEK